MRSSGVRRVRQSQSRLPDVPITADRPDASGTAAGEGSVKQRERQVAFLAPGISGG